MLGNVTGLEYHYSPLLKDEQVVVVNEPENLWADMPRKRTLVGKALYFALEMTARADECDFDRFPHEWDWVSGRSIRTNDYPRPKNQQDQSEMLGHFLQVYRAEKGVLERKAQLQRQAELAWKLYGR